MAEQLSAINPTGPAFLRFMKDTVASSSSWSRCSGVRSGASAISSRRTPCVRLR